MRTSFAALAAGIAALTLSAAQASAQDVAAGEKSFAKCRVCHQVGETAKNAVGPVLNGLIGRHSGSVEGYSYSEANKNSGITWDEAQLDEYIADPKKKIPGNKMLFPGVKDEVERSDLIAYLASFNADGTNK